MAAGASARDLLQRPLYVDALPPGRGGVPQTLPGVAAARDVDALASEVAKGRRHHADAVIGQRACVLIGQSRGGLRGGACGDPNGGGGGSYPQSASLRFPVFGIKVQPVLLDLQHGRVGPVDQLETRHVGGQRVELRQVQLHEALTRTPE